MATNARRGPIYAEYRPPAPVYERKTTVGIHDHCSTFSRAPAYSMGIPHRETRPMVPGPTYSYDAQLTSQGKKSAPSYSLASRPKAKDIEITPGPGSYNSQGVKQGSVSHEKKSTSVVIGHRTSWPFKHQAPPPNNYSVRAGIGSGSHSEKYTPSWSLGTKTDVGGSSYQSVKASNPGPGAYGATDPKLFKSASGSFTIQGRTRVKDYNTVKENPGPGAYEPANPKVPGKKGFSMGIRHSEFTMPCITDVDVA